MPGTRGLGRTRRDLGRVDTPLYRERRVPTTPRCRWHHRPSFDQDMTASLATAPGDGAATPDACPAGRVSHARLVPFPIKPLGAAQGASSARCLLAVPQPSRCGLEQTRRHRRGDFLFKPSSGFGHREGQGYRARLATHTALSMSRRTPTRLAPHRRTTGCDVQGEGLRQAPVCPLSGEPVHASPSAPPGGRRVRRRGRAPGGAATRC